MKGYLLLKQERLLVPAWTCDVIWRSDKSFYTKISTLRVGVARCLLHYSSACSLITYRKDITQVSQAFF